jgi:hypothetical protein
MRYYRNYGAKNINLAPIDDLVKVLPTQEQTGKIVTFDSPFAGLPLKAHKVAISSQSGISAINIGATGKNLFSYNLTIRDGYWANGFFGTNVIVPKENAGGWQYIRVCVEGLSSVTLSGFDTTGGTNCAWLSSENPNDIISEFNSSNKNRTKTVPSGAKYLCLVIFSIKNNSTTYPNAQIEIGDTATAFEPFGTYTTIQIGSTVNEATYNARTGVMEVTQPSVQTIQLPPCPIYTLQGENNLFASTGDTTVQYFKK